MLLNNEFSNRPFDFWSESLTFVSFLLFWVNKFWKRFNPLFWFSFFTSNNKLVWLFPNKLLFCLFSENNGFCRLNIELLFNWDFFCSWFSELNKLSNVDIFSFLPHCLLTEENKEGLLFCGKFILNKLIFSFLFELFSFSLVWACVVGGNNEIFWEILLENNDFSLFSLLSFFSIFNWLSLIDLS